MFLGYKEKFIEGSEVPTLFISHIAETREELENMPCVAFVKIEETDKTYFLHNGSYVYEVPYGQQVEEIRQARAYAYKTEVDPLMAEYTRKKTFNLFEEGEETELLNSIETKVAEIKENNLYPVVEVITTETDETVENVESAVIGKEDLQVEEHSNVETEEVI